MPSVADLIFLALLGVLLFTPLSSKLLGDAGIGWHVRTGQQILATHAIPHADSFSSSTAGKNWYAWEWPYDVLAGQLETSLGLNGVVWLTALVIAVVFAWTFRILILRSVTVLPALILTLLAISASTIHFLTRPHVWSWLFTLAFFGILESSERGCGEGGLSQTKNKTLWFLPLLMLIWVNVHGGFLVGILLIAIFWLGALWDWYATKANRIEDTLRRIAVTQRTRKLTLIGLLSFAATFLNPYGWKLHTHIYAYLSNRFLMNHVEEFQSPNFHQIAPRCFAVLLLLTLAALAWRGRYLRVSEGLIVLFAAYAGLYAARNIPVSSILLVVTVAPLLCHGSAARSEMSPGLLSRMTAVERRQRGHLWCVAAALATLAICFNSGRVSATPLIDAHFDQRRMPVEAVNYLEQNDTAGPLLTPDYWGGYVIYRLYPKTQVIVDDRHDLYGEEFLRAYLTFIHAERGWQQFLVQHRAGSIVVPRDSAIASVLSESSEWRAVYADDVAIVFRAR